MSILLNGSIDLTMLIEKAKAGHSAFSKSDKNGHIYVNITQWVNDEPNEFGQHSSFLLNSKSKEKQAEEGKVYFGNAKKAEAGGGSPVAANDLPTGDELDKLPF
jgi:hypothetical protein